MIAESIWRWLYSRLSTMNARAFFVRALLLAVVLAPSAMRASVRPLGASLCRVPKPQLPAGSFKGHAGHTPDELVGWLPNHHGPTPRLHRIRGKKISIQRAFALAPRCYTRTSFLFSFASAVQQDMDGPNPSRGPPSQLSL